MNLFTDISRMFSFVTRWMPYPFGCVNLGGRQADATVMAATAAASARSATRSSNLLLRRSGSLMDFNGELNNLITVLWYRLLQV